MDQIKIQMKTLDHPYHMKSTPLYLNMVLAEHIIKEQDYSIEHHNIDSVAIDFDTELSFFKLKWIQFNIIILEYILTGKRA